MSDKQIEEYIQACAGEYHANEANRKDNREVIKIFYMEYHYWQLRKSHQWVEEQYELGGDRLTIQREILLQRMRGSSESPIDQGDLEYLIQHTQQPINDILLNNKWKMEIYAHGVTTSKNMIQPGVFNYFNPKIPYLVGVDPAGGGGGDNISITVINPYNLQIAAEFKSPYISGTELLRALIDLVNNYIPKAVVIIEKNSMGIYLIHNAVESSIRDNLYWGKKAKELETMTIEGPDAELKKLSQQYRKYGVYTSPAVRHAMFELLFKHIHECKQILNSKNLVDDLCRLIRNTSGKIVAGKGEHDDSVMSYNIAIYIYYTGDNLEFFGIDKGAHPILGLLEPNLDEILASKDPLTGFFTTEDVTYETIMRDSIIETEQYSKYITEVNPRVEDPYYKRGQEDSSENVDIPIFFFNQINNW